MSSKKGQKSSSGTRPLNLALGHRSPILPVNCEDQKVRFLRDGKLPEFVLRGSSDEVKRLNSQDKAVVRFDHLEEAERILNLVRNNYGDSKAFLDVMYGPEINKQKAAKAVSNYIHNNNLEGHMTVNWCPDLACSATMMWQGPALKYNRPEARRFSLWICDSKANTFLREQGITSLLHHEIGTHYFRMHNDGLQPWFSDRKRFHLQGISSRKLGVTEEGLASIHTVLDSNSKFLWTGALLYYAACKAEQMSFRELFDHLERYVEDKEQRWKHCLRVKRGQENVNVPGGYGKDQCYFEGAVKLLKNIDKIDFVVLMAGKICYDEVNRCKRLARTDIIKLPHFMNNAEKYKRTLREIAKVNCLAPDDIPRPMGREKPSHRPSTNAKTASHQSTQGIPVPQKPESPKPFESDGHLSARSAHSDASAKTPQVFRYTHTPTNSASLASRDSTTRADSRLTNTEDKLSLAENQEELFGSSQSVRASSPYRPKTARTRSVCATDVVEVPDIKHYSERLLHRKSVEGFKASHKRKKKRKRKKATHREPEPAPTAENTSSEEDVHRFGCLRSKSRNEEKEDMSEL